MNRIITWDMKAMWGPVGLQNKINKGTDWTGEKDINEEDKENDEKDW